MLNHGYAVKSYHPRF